MDTLLLVEKNTLHGDSLRDLLAGEDYIVLLAMNNSQNESVMSRHFDGAIIAYEHHAYINALEAKAAITGESRCPVLCLIDSEYEGSDVTDFGEMKCDEILTVPFKYSELLAIIRRQITCRKYRTSNMFHTGNAIVDPVSMTLVNSRGVTHKITDMELKLLVCLHRAGGKTVRRGQLLSEVWGYVLGIETSTLDTHVYRLRKKLELDPSNPIEIIYSDGGYHMSSHK